MRLDVRPVLRNVLLPLAVLVGLSACDPMMIEGCDSTESVQVYCGYEKPEDLEPLGQSPWILISELGGQGTPGAITALNLDTEDSLRLDARVSEVSGYERCGPPPSFLRPRGFHVSELETGGFRLLVVNVTESQRIERYRIDLTGDVPSMTWEGCVTVPNELQPNDVAATAGDGFVISHMYDPPRNTWLTVKFLLGLKTGYAAAWDPENGWRKVEGTDASFANGVEYHPATGRVFIAATYGETLSAADLDGGFARTIRIPVQSDNVTWSDDGRLLAVGHTGIPLLGTRGCRNANGSPCSFPFAVTAIDPVTLEQEVIYTEDEGQIPGASVAMKRAGSLYFGTVFGDRVSRVRLPLGDG